MIKTNKIKNIVSGLMLVVGVSMQIMSTQFQIETNQQLQACQQQFITQIGHRLANFRQSFIKTHLKQNNRTEKGE